MALPAMYSFPEGSGVTLAGPPWLVVAGYAPLEGDGAGHCMNSDPSTDNTCLWTADAFSADQYAQTTVANNPGAGGQHYALIFLRSPNVTFAGPPDGYAFWCDGVSDAGIGLVSGGTFSTLASLSSLTYASGDTFKFEAIGTNLTAYKNGVGVMSATDSTYTGGYPGLDIYDTSFGTVRLGSFLADNAGGSGGTVHAASGRGSFTVTSPNWLSTAVSGRPGQLTAGNAEPPNWYHVGMLSWGTSNGAIESYPVTRDLDLVQLPSGMTTVWYEFITGISVIITELSTP